MIGVGPGALPSDAFMMGIDPAKQRDMMEESLEAILLLLLEAGSRSPWRRTGSSWSRPACRCGPTSARSPRWRWRRRCRPAGPRAAGQVRLQPALDRGHLGRRLRRPRRPLGRHGGAGRRVRHHRRPQRKWRLVGPMHIADTKEQAVADVAFGLEEWVDYFQRVAALPAGPRHRPTSNAGRRPQRLGLRRHRHGGRRHRPGRPPAAQSKGFGTFLLMGHEWADTAATRHSYELIARYVAPRVPGLRAPSPPAGTGRPRTAPSSSARRATPSCPPSRSTTKRKRPRPPMPDSPARPGSMA
jgi:limonene 1,2-monooxygenase